MGDLFLHMRSHPLWDEFEQKLLDHYPSIPPYIHSSDNTEEWKYNSAKREGFELCLTLIGVKENDQ